MKNQTIIKSIHLAFLLFIGMISSVESQELKKLDSVMALEIVDSLLVDRDVNNWSIRVFANYKDQNILLENDGNKADYYPNNRSGIGFGYANKKLYWISDSTLKKRIKKKQNASIFRGRFLRNNDIFSIFLYKIIRASMLKIM